jgi:signal transduction histidine kinase
MTNKSCYVLAIVSVTLLTTSLHFATMRAFSQYVVLEELYYLPLLLGVLRFGLAGAIVTWLFVSAAYLPFFFAPWTTSFPGYVDRSLHLALSGVVAVVVGLLAERERRSRLQGEQERYLAGLGRVATVVVHDLKNPLISILGFARRISEGKGNSVQAAQTITESAQTMQRIVNEVLDLAKPMQLDLRNCDVGETISRAVDVCRTKADARGVFLTINVPAEPITIELDSFHVERALVNLIDNAIDASGSGGEVVVTSAADSQGIFVTVKDHGAGMDGETMAHLFEPFYTTKSGGTGLGMPIAKKIFEEHGGTLVITSKPGGGTEARGRLPVSKPEGRRSVSWSK